IVGTVGQAGELDAEVFVRESWAEADWSDNTATLKIVPGPPFAAPAIPGSPVVIGTPVPGRTLTATPPTWSASARHVRYRWQLCTARRCAPIKGATKPTLKLGTGYLGRGVRLVASATIGGKIVRA